MIITSNRPHPEPGKLELVSTILKLVEGPRARVFHTVHSFLQYLFSHHQNPPGLPGVVKILQSEVSILGRLIISL